MGIKEITEKLIKVVELQLGMGEGTVRPEQAFVDDLGCDSLDTVEVVMMAEEVFDVVINDEMLEGCDYDSFTVAQAAELIKSIIEGD